jgi:hypothetical protein
MLTPNQKNIEQILVTITQNPNGYWIPWKICYDRWNLDWALSSQVKRKSLKWPYCSPLLAKFYASISPEVVATVFGFRMEFLLIKYLLCGQIKTNFPDKKRTDGDYTQTEDFFNVINVLELY